MFLAKVVGKVVSTQKSEGLVGTKLLMIKAIDDQQKIIEDKSSLVAIDTAGAGIGEVVLVITGSLAGTIYENTRIPADAAIVGIVDSIEVEKVC